MRVWVGPALVGPGRSVLLKGVVVSGYLPAQTAYGVAAASPADALFS